MKENKNLKSLILCIAVIAIFTLLSMIIYAIWTPGKNITDGRHDLGKNGIWMQHGWLGDDNWFSKYRKKEKIPSFRSADEIEKLASLLRKHHITDLFPHLCPTSVKGIIPSVDPDQTKLFLEIFKGFNVMPWVGGVLGVQAFPDDPSWRRNFVVSIYCLLTAYPNFAGIHINIEPCSSGSKDFLILLEELRSELPDNKILSVAAFPPSTLLHPFPQLHWNREYYNQVAKYADQIVVMMYDTSIRFEKVYQKVMSNWAEEILEWSGDTNVLFGLPAYNDEGVGYHDSEVENLKNSLLGVHSGLMKYNLLPKNYQGIAIYCEWEMDHSKWETLGNHFIMKTYQNAF